MEPTVPGSFRTAAHRKRYTDGQNEELQITRLRVLATSWCSSRRRAASCGQGPVARMGPLGVSISVVTAEQRRPASFCGRRGDWIRSASGMEASGLSNSGAASRQVGGRLAQVSFDELGSANGITRFDRRAGLQRFGLGSRSPSRRFAGSSARHRHCERFVWRGAHSSGGITSGCT